MFDDDSDDDIMSSDGALDYDDIQEPGDNLYEEEGRLGPLQVRDTNRLSWLPVKCQYLDCASDHYVSKII